MTLSSTEVENKNGKEFKIHFGLLIDSTDISTADTPYVLSDGQSLFIKMQPQTANLNSSVVIRIVRTSDQATLQRMELADDSDSVVHVMVKNGEKIQNVSLGFNQKQVVSISAPGNNKKSIWGVVAA
eukprot:949889_1